MRYTSSTLQTSLVSICILAVAACGDQQATTPTSSAEDMSSMSTEDVDSAAGEDMNSGEAPTPDMSNKPTSNDLGDTTASPDATVIHLLGDSITVEGEGADNVSTEGTTATITAPGTYKIDGELGDGAVIIDSPADGDVLVQLDGVHISSSTGSPLYALEADEFIIELLSGTENRLEDAQEYVFETPEEDEPNAALFSKDDMQIIGSGSLVVTANYNDGITSKDDLDIDMDGAITITAADDGIRGKDSITMMSGAITITAGGDGLKSDEDEDEAKGIIEIQGGSLQIDAGGDGLQAERQIQISDGDIDVVAGGGSSARLAEDASAKGLKSPALVHVSGGMITLDTADDAVHSDDTIRITGGAFEISSGDDGVHADLLAHIAGGSIHITRAYEGIESEEVIIDGGDLHLTTSDDGLNGAGGESASPGGFGPPGGPGGAAGDYRLEINGGYTVINALGDGVDANGDIEMTGGVMIVHGPSADNNGALDYDSTFAFTGGTLIATGSSRMAQAPTANLTTQPTIQINLSSAQQASTLFHVADASGEAVLTLAPAHRYQSVVFSTPDMMLDETYTYFVGGSSTGASLDGVYADGVYTPGEQVGQVTTTSVITKVGGNNRP